MCPMRSLIRKLIHLLRRNPSMPQPQLEMRRPHLDAIPAVPLPAGHAMRTYRPGDEAAWAAIMNECIGSGWTVERCRKSLIEQPQFEPEGLFFALCGEAPVGAACAWRTKAEERQVGYVHMVGVLRAHRGKRLGWAASVEVLKYLKQRGFSEARLLTDDFRLSAVRSYIGIGFDPLITHESHPDRWKKVHEQLGMNP